jgi:hypothetical protein
MFHLLCIRLSSPTYTSIFRCFIILQACLGERFLFLKLLSSGTDLSSLKIEDCLVSDLIRLITSDTTDGDILVNGVTSKYLMKYYFNILLRATYVVSLSALRSKYWLISGDLQKPLIFSSAWFELQMLSILAGLHRSLWK